MNLRLLALGAVVTCAIALPLAMASAGPVGDDHESGAVRVSGRGDAKVPGAEESRGDAEVSRDDGEAPGEEAAASDPARSPSLLGLGLATATRCGPEVTSPTGIEAQTCVLTQGEESWARTYYRNPTGEALDAVLSLMGPNGRTVQMRCPVGAEDESASCETPRERMRGEPTAYSAVAEFAARGGQGSSLLRSGSNSWAPTGS
ncbi:hypothetical protein SSP24_51620 [Streptomyces spinoverrucosus]|uniref:Subtilisin inhibitor domain-containing protein n=1 Tax=Streptomyces spinoverrucosus TaxID=284043 RepID=A0A4Y3VKY0_9ACTN|nr:hypothetical protein [Streptomyces spinoverrucosus]GEC07507.1 hypothetical protein SSP24_51620 [Streptomyces spinoverrucosus]GHB63817.1 hypothetical protein GCM10010397_37370 [Streptomyces spinoverrucosus]